MNDIKVVDLHVTFVESGNELPDRYRVAVTFAQGARHWSRTGGALSLQDVLGLVEAMADEGVPA
jgi:hypothetical protein